MNGIGSSIADPTLGVEELDEITAPLGGLIGSLLGAILGFVDSLLGGLLG